MRRIKFRGKREDNGEWVYGAFYPIKDEPVYFIINNCQSIDFDDNSTFFNGYKVHKKSIGQFTGLNDKKGKEIYEGDIIEDTLGRKKIVEYFQDGFWLNASFDGAEWSLRRENSSSKVIGNIYENPELLTD